MRVCVIWPIQINLGAAFIQPLLPGSVYSYLIHMKMATLINWPESAGVKRALNLIIMCNVLLGIIIYYRTSIILNLNKTKIIKDYSLEITSDEIL